VIYGIKLVASYLLGTDVVGRRLAVFPDDTFIVSYPRSGNTWVRFLIANLLHPDPDVTFANIEKLIPDTSSQSSRTLKRTPRPRFIKAHEYFDHRYRKVIYLVRDPRDVVLSYYDFQRKYRQIEDGYPIERYVDDFVQGRLISAGWGTWAENVASWIGTRGKHPGFLLVRYEDLQADPSGELARIAAFLGVDPRPGLLSRAQERSSAERMRKLEKLQSDEWVATRNRREDIAFIRTATCGTWKTHLPHASLLQIESSWGELMSSLGYQLVCTTMCVGSANARHG
jgi:hypothetical protein